MLLTPPGAGAIAVVRVIGPEAVALLNRAFHAKNGKPLSPRDADHLRYGHFMDGDEVIDDVIVSVSLHPCVPASLCPSFCVDVSCHGGIRVVERILHALERLGAAACEPFPALDDVWPARNVIEREAVHALCTARTQRALRLAAWQRDNLVPAIETMFKEAQTDPTRACEALKSMIARFPVARIILHGATVALVGPPNSGKSTLFNRLLGRPAAVVSPVPGTTRDWIAEAIELDGAPITLVDTAGVHEGQDSLERLAIEASQRVAQHADVHILVLDGASPQPAEPAAPDAAPHILRVVNKVDLGNLANLGLPISAKTGQGVPLLLDRLRETIGLNGLSDDVPALFTQRQVRSAAGLLAALQSDPLTAAQYLADWIGGPA